MVDEGGEDLGVAFQSRYSTPSGPGEDCQGRRFSWRSTSCGVMGWVSSSLLLAGSSGSRSVSHPGRSELSLLRLTAGVEVALQRGSRDVAGD